MHLVRTGEKPRPFEGLVWGFEGPPLPHSWLWSQAGSILHHIKAPPVPLYGRVWGPLVQRQIRARSYLCGWRCPAGQRLRALVPAAPAPPTQPSILTDAVLGFSSSGPLMVPLHGDRSLRTSGALDRWSTSLCLIFLPSEWDCSCTRAPPVLGCMNKMHVGQNWVPRGWGWK